MKRQIRLSSWSTDVNKLHEKTRRSTIRESILSWSILTSLQNFCARISTAEKFSSKTKEDKTCSVETNFWQKNSSKTYSPIISWKVKITKNLNSQKKSVKNEGWWKNLHFHELFSTIAKYNSSKLSLIFFNEMTIFLVQRVDKGIDVLFRKVYCVLDNDIELTCDASDGFSAAK